MTALQITLIDSVLCYRVTDPAKSVITVAEAGAAIYQLAMTSLRNSIGQHDLDEVLQERDMINTTCASASQRPPLPHHDRRPFSFTDGDRQMRTRPAFTLVELLVVLAIIAVLVGLLLPAIHRVREAAARMNCGNNLKQLGLALHAHHATAGRLPPGITTTGDVGDAAHTAFTHLLPYLEQDPLYRQFTLARPWYDMANYNPVAAELPFLYCPSNRTGGSINLAGPLYAWGGPLPPSVGGTDYLLCKGANASLHSDASSIPRACRGVFNVQSPRGLVVRLTDVTDGTSNTFAIGEGAGNNPRHLLRRISRDGPDITVEDAPAIDPFTSQTIRPDQAWAAASISDAGHPWYAGVFGVTAQFGLAPDPRDEPMNNPLVMPSAYAAIDGDNRRGTQFLSGFRSMHRSGCNFLFCDGGVRFVHESIDPALYRALSTHAGGEVASPR